MVKTGALPSHNLLPRLATRGRTGAITLRKEGAVLER
jgi:hypothetical protein